MNRVERIDAEERYLVAAASALLRRHPQAAWLVQTKISSLNNTTLVEATRRLEAWLEQYDRDHAA